LLVDCGPGDDRQVHAAEFLRRLRGPQAGLLRFLANFGESCLRNVLMLGEIFGICFQRQNVLFDKSPHTQAEVLHLGRKREIHASLPYPLIWMTCPPSTTMVAPVI